MTYNDYMKALVHAGPKLTEQILSRAAEDRDIGLMEFVKLSDFACSKTRGTARVYCN